LRKVSITFLISKKSPEETETKLVAVFGGLKLKPPSALYDYTDTVLFLYTSIRVYTPVVSGSYIGTMTNDGISIRPSIWDIALLLPFFIK
jgi:hypothetical protein